jgi:hypothetical protein
MWEPRRLTILWASTACYRDSFTFYTAFLCSLFNNAAIVTLHTSVEWIIMSWKGCETSDGGLIEVLSRIFVGGTKENLDEEPQNIWVACRQSNTPPTERKSEAFLLESIC